MWIERPTLDLARHVTLNMRAADRHEIFATKWDDDLEAYARTAVGWQTDFSWVVGLDEPIAMVGAVQWWPGVWTAFMWATDRFPEVGIPLTWFVRKCMIPAVYEADAHRVEALSMATHVEAHRWLEHLGAHKEATLSELGKNREDFVIYKWSRDDVQRRR